MVSRAAALTVFCLATGAQGAELIHPYPPTGPFEVAGAPAANKSLRAVQRYAMPAFTDPLAQHVAHALQTASDGPYAVVRKSRRSGKEAIEAVMKAPADGRTLLFAIDAPLLRGIARVAVMPYVIVVHAESRFGDVADLIASLRGSPNRVLAASAGETTSSHRALGLLRTKYDLRVEPVSYKGGYAALQALAGKEVSVALVPLPSVTPYLSGGRVKVLPAAKTANIEVSDAFHVFARQDTPNIVIARLNVALAEKLLTADAEAVFSNLGVKLEHRPAGQRSSP